MGGIVDADRELCFRELQPKQQLRGNSRRMETRTLSLSKDKCVLVYSQIRLYVCECTVARDNARNWDCITRALEPHNSFSIFRNIFCEYQNFSEYLLNTTSQYFENMPLICFAVIEDRHLSRILVGTKFSGKYSTARNFRRYMHVS